MSNKKQIDRLFQERFKDFEAIPDDAVWDTIHETLHGKKKKRRLIPIWWRVGGIAAGLALLFTIGNVLFNTNETIAPEATTTIVTTETEKNPSTANTNHSSEQNSSKDSIARTTKNLEKNVKTESELAETSNSKNTLNKTGSNAQNVQNVQNLNASKTLITETSINNTSNLKNRTAQTSKIEDKLKVSDAINKEGADSSETLAQTKTSEHDKSDLIKGSNKIDKSKTDKLIKNTQKSGSKGLAKVEDSSLIENDTITTLPIKALEDKPSIFDELDKKEDIVADKAIESNRWNVMPNIAPVYFNTLGKGSSIHSQFRTNDKSGQINMSYGIAASYSISNKLSVRSGINKVNVGYNTNDVIIYNGLETSFGGAGRAIETINYNENAQAITVVTAANLPFSQVPDVVNNAVDASLDQNLGFVEVPLELAYKISDKKLGISVIGGMSALFLSDNEVSSTLNGNRTLLGEANNVRNTSFSANFGLGMDYKLSEKFNINLEPVFKYQMNTFESKSGDFKPFLIGVYTGFSFKF